MPRIPEDHRFEQFFFSAATRDYLTALAAEFTLPLMVCMPSLAEALHAQGRRHILLDRDQRFAHLPSYQRFDLHHPHMVFSPFDAIFIDPPFSNIDLPELRRTIDLLASAAPTRPPLYLCYTSTREQALLRTFAHFSLKRLRGPLGYRTVKAATQQRICLYGP